MNQTIVEKVEQVIIEEVRFAVAELNLEDITDRMKIKEKIKTELHSYIRDAIAREVEASLMIHIQKKRPIIDAWTANKVTAIVGEVEKL